MLFVAIDHPPRSYVRTCTREFTDRGVRFNTLSPATKCVETQGKIKNDGHCHDQHLGILDILVSGDA
jgi:hypothetical protein